MTNLFNARPVAVSSTEAWFLMELDPSEPYLDDHQPGGEPLFGTAMCIEALVGAARNLLPISGPLAVSRVSVQIPLIVKDHRNCVVHAKLVKTAENSVDGQLLTIAPDGAESVHLVAQVAMADPRSRRVPPMPSDTDVHTVISGPEIYECFFHGPSYRVIEHAQWLQGRMRCRLASPLPRSHRASHAKSELSPRLIELGLQTAGLLELAYRGHIMIPHSIASIERRRPIDVDGSQALYACAYREPGRNGTYVNIVDETGSSVMSIEDYCSVPIPFAVNDNALALLRDRLRTL